MSATCFRLRFGAAIQKKPTIILVLANQGGIISPPIKRSPRVRAVQVHRILPVRMINKSHDRFTSLLHLESRTRGLAIISNKTSLSEVGIYLTFERFDVYLEIVDRRSVGESERSQGLLDWSNWHLVLVQVVVWWAVPVFRFCQTSCERD
jgi:hypothetical protein